MNSKIGMDYIFLEEGKELLIEPMQRKAKQDLVSQYIRCRKEQKITQEELARRTGMARTNIARLESGNYNPTLEMMVKVAVALDMNLSICLEKIK